MRMPGRFLCVCLLALPGGAPVRADIPVPGETPEQAAARRAQQWQMRVEPELRAQRAAQGPPGNPNAVPLTIKGRRYQADVRLLLPRRLLGGLQAPSPPGASAPVGGGAGLALRTAVAGVALSLALAWVGLRVVRSRRRLAFAGLGALLIGAAVLATGCPRRDPFPEVEGYRPLPVSVAADGRLSGQAYVELSDGSDEVVLRMSNEQLSQLISRSGLKTEPAR
jgi:hypothetical protein